MPEQSYNHVQDFEKVAGVRMEGFLNEIERARTERDLDSQNYSKELFQAYEDFLMDENFKEGEEGDIRKKTYERTLKESEAEILEVFETRR